LPADLLANLFLQKSPIEHCPPFGPLPGLDEPVVPQPTPSPTSVVVGDKASALAEQPLSGWRKRLAGLIPARKTLLLTLGVVSCAVGIALIVSCLILCLWEPHQNSWIAATASEPVPVEEEAPVTPSVPVTRRSPVASRPSPLDQLDPAHIPPTERNAEQPNGLVAVLGSSGVWPAPSDVSCLACSPDGKRIVAGYGDNRIRIHDTVTMRQTACLQGHTAAVICLSFAPDGKMLASIDRVGVVGLWQFGEEIELKFFLFSPKVEACSSSILAFSPDGKLLATNAKFAGKETSVHLWDLSGERPHCRWTLWRGADQLAFYPDGRTLITWSTKGAWLWDVSGTRPGSFWFSPCWSISLSWTGRVFRSLLLLGAICLLVGLGLLWFCNPHPKENRPQRQQWYAFCLGRAWAGALLLSLVGLLSLPWWINWFHADRPVAYAFLGQQAGLEELFGDDSGTMCHFSFAEETITLQNEHKEIRSWKVGDVVFSPDRRLLACVHHAQDSSEKAVELWELGENPRRRTIIQRHMQHGKYGHLVFTPDSKTLVSGGEDGTLLSWDLTGDPPRERFKQVSGHGHVLFVPGPRRDDPARARQGPEPVTLIETQTAANTIRVWGLTGPAPTERACLRGLAQPLQQLSRSSSGGLLAYMDIYGGLRLWDLTTTPPRERAGLADKGLISIQWTPDWRWLAAGMWGEKVNAWSVRQHLRYNFHRVGKLGEVEVWDLAGNLPRKRPDIAPPGTEYLGFTADGCWSVTADEQGVVTLWDVTGDPVKERGRLPPPYYTKRIETFSSPTSRFLAVEKWDWKSGIIDVHERPFGYEGRPMLGVWNLSDKEPTWLPLLDETESIYGIVFSADDKHLAACCGGSVKVWDLVGAAPRLRATLTTPADEIRRLRFSADGKTLTTWGDKKDPSVRRWDLTGVEHTQLSKSPWSGGKPSAATLDQDLFVVDEVVQGFQTLTVWAEGGEKLWEWQPPGAVRSVEFAPDGRHLALVNGNGTLYVVRLEDPKADDRLLASCNEVLRRDPKNRDAYRLRGQLHQRQGQFAQAVADLNEALHGDSPDSLKAQAYHLRGQAHADLGNFAQARQDFAEAVHLDPSLGAASEASPPEQEAPIAPRPQSQTAAKTGLPERWEGSLFAIVCVLWVLFGIWLLVRVGQFLVLGVAGLGPDSLEVSWLHWKPDTLLRRREQLREYWSRVGFYFAFALVLPLWFAWLLVFHWFRGAFFICQAWLEEQEQPWKKYGLFVLYFPLAFVVWGIMAFVCFGSLMWFIHFASVVWVKVTGA